MSHVVLGWQRREPPLPIAGVIAEGKAAIALVERLADRMRKETVDVSVYTADRMFVVLGEAQELPWIDGATWIGRDGQLLCPTALVPDLPTDLVTRAVRRSYVGTGPTIVTPFRAFLAREASRPPTLKQLAAIASNLSVT